MWAAESKPQPIPYSHKTHVALGLKCVECHTMPAPGELATFPKEAKCMSCHVAVKTDSPAIQKLAEFHKQQKAVPWVRVYKIPEYVYFSHRVHYKDGKVACEMCHGPVAERDVLTREKSNNMAECMFCHDERRISIACNFCHNP